MENEKKALLLRSKYGIGYILPVVMDACHISKNANYKKYVEYEKNLDSLFIEKALKTAWEEAQRFDKRTGNKIL